jgi:hypothetical protein
MANYTVSNRYLSDLQMIEIAGGILLAVFVLYLIAYAIGHSSGGGYQVTREERRKWESENPDPVSFRIMTWIVISIFGYGIVMAISEHFGLLS